MARIDATHLLASFQGRDDGCYDVKPNYRMFCG